MDQGVGAGIAEGLGEGLGDLGNQLRQNNFMKMKLRDQQADDLTTQIKSIADNIAKVGGKDAPEAAPLIEQLNSTIQRHNALYPPHETPALLARLKTMMGHKPGAAQPDVRSQMTPEGMMAAAPIPTNNILQEVNNLTQVHVKGGTPLEDARKLAIQEVTEKYKVNDWTPATGDAGNVYPGPEPAPDSGEAQKYFRLELNREGKQREVEVPAGTYEAGWKALEGVAGVPHEGPDGRVYQTQVNKAGTNREALMPGVTPDMIKAKQLRPNINNATGGLDSITDPNRNKVWTASMIADAPADVQTMWNDITKQVQGETQRKADVEKEKVAESERMLAKREAQQFEIQNRSFQNMIAGHDYTAARKEVDKVGENYHDALDRMSTMDQNQRDALKGDQQAMLSLVSNHIGMTIGAQKGARITRAAFEEAQNSAPWLARMGARWSSDGYLSGVTLTPDQMEQMVRLAREKVETWKKRKTDVENEYHDALNPRPAGSSAPAAAPAGGKPDPVDEQILKLLQGKK
jgi:hypothetical protein